MDYLTPIFTKVFSLFMGLLTLLGFIKIPASGGDIKADHKTDNTNYTYVYVHGFWGWGDYDKANETLPYWGFFTGNELDTMNEKGYRAAAASVDPVGSAWDRACELYAELTGTKVDYGQAHSEKYGHDRYGEDYTGHALIKSWSEKDKINIIAHSFGAPTASLFASVLEYGSPEEQTATKDGTLSDFFKGGKGNWIYSITGVAGTYNGTTMVLNSQALEVCADDLYKDIEKLLPFASKGQLSIVEKMLDGIFGTLAKVATGEVGAPDTGLYDMNPDNAAELNKTIKTVDSIYYFAVPHCTTEEDKDGTHQNPRLDISDFMFMPTSCVIGRTNTVTKGGIVLDKSWQPNDGLVNTISEKGPFNAERKEIGAAPSADLAKAGFDKGVYNIFSTYEGSHMALMGNPMRPDDSAVYYLIELMNTINAI